MDFLTFSDSAKFAQAAINLLKGKSLTITHSFFSTNLLDSFQSNSLFSVNFPPLPSWLLSLLFRFFPATDTNIAIFGLVFLAFSALIVFLIGKKLHSTVAGLLTSVFFLSSLFFQEYALNFASEIPFTLLILLFTYFILLPKGWKLLSTLPLVALFFTRQQAAVFLGAVLLTLLVVFLTSKISNKKKVAFIGALFLLAGVGLVVDRFTPISILPTKIFGSFNIGAGSNFGTYIRGGDYQSLSLFGLASKIFYNLYNFIKAPSRLLSPILFFLFMLGLFIKPKKRELTQFKFFTVISLLAFLLAASATLPNARYVHPVIPLVIILAATALVDLVKVVPKKLKKLVLVVLSLFIIFPTIGHLTLDARSRSQQFNTDQPPVYRHISSIMADHIEPGHLIITNLDAWAAWYEGLTTMWFPLQIDMLAGYENKIDYIVITNYLEDDGDFALGEWSQVVYAPEDLRSQWLIDNFDLLTTLYLTPEQVYENQPYQGTILINRRLVN